MPTTSEGGRSFNHRTDLVRGVGRVTASPASQLQLPGGPSGRDDASPVEDQSNDSNWMRVVPKQLLARFPLLRPVPGCDRPERGRQGETQERTRLMHQFIHLTTGPAAILVFVWLEMLPLDAWKVASAVRRPR